MTFSYNNVYIADTATVSGPYEKKGPLGKYFDKTYDDLYFGEKSFEKAEIKLVTDCIDILKKKTPVENNFDVVIGGDLMNQITASTYGCCGVGKSFIGVYGACSSSVLGLIIGANFIEKELVENSLCVVSSHNLSSERQFRYPIEYGAPKSDYSTYTATGSTGVIVSKRKSNIKVESATIGKVIDSKTKDVNNMGAVMAISACNTLYQHLKDLNRNINYYDLILTGDLGIYGSKIFKEYLNKEYNLKLKNHIDAGSNIYKKEQNLYAGSSGPVSLPLYLFTNIISKNKYKKILLLATGSLHSPTLVNQKNTLLSTCHAISLEVL